MKILKLIFLVLFLQSIAYAQVHTEVTIEDTQTITGNKGHSGVLNQTGSMTVGSENSVLWVDGVKYTTIASAIAALPTSGCGAQAGPCGGVVVLPPHYRETFTTKIDLGSSTEPVILDAYPDVIVTCNVTDGTYCFNVHNGSGITGHNVGSNSFRDGGFTIFVASTANVANAIDTGEKNVSGGQAYMILSNFFLNGNASATVSIAMVNIENLLGQAKLDNFYVVVGANTVLVRLATNANPTGTGPLVLNNIWADCQGNAGCIPLRIMSDGTKSFLPLDVVGGVFNHPGTSGCTGLGAAGGNQCPMVDINGTGIALGGMAGIHIHTFVEDLGTGLSIGFRIRDAVAVDLTGSVCSLQDNDTCIDISESGVNKTASIHFGSVFKASATNAATLVNNHITGETSTSAVQPFYNFGGESGTSMADFTISSNPVSIYDRSNHKLYSFPIAGNPIFRNFLDAGHILTVDSGSTAAQNASYYFSDRGTAEWSFDKDTGQNFDLFDRVNGKIRWFFPQSAAPATAGNMRFASTETIGWRNNANGADVILSKTAGASGTTPADTLDTSQFGAIKTAGIVATNLLMSTTAPSIAGAGCGGSAASIPANNGTAAFTVNVGTAPTSAGCTVTLPTATTGWTCRATDITTTSTGVFYQKQTGGSTTTAIIQNFSDVAVATAPTASDVYRVSCEAY